MQRASLPAMVILSPYNKQEPYWTKEKPLDPVLLHMQLIAKKAYEVLLNQFYLCKEGRIRSETASLDFKVSSFIIENIGLCVIIVVGIFSSCSKSLGRLHLLLMQ